MNQARRLPARRLLVVTSTWPLSRDDHRTPFVRDLALDLAQRNWAVQVLAPHAPGAARREVDADLVVDRFRYMYPQRLETLAYGSGGLVNLRKGGRLWLAATFVLAEIMAIRAAMRRFQPDVIHAHWLLPQGFAACLAALGSGIPVVVTIHGGDVFGLTGRIHQPFKRFAVRHASRISVNGRLTGAAARDLGAAPEKIETIRFGPAYTGTVDPAAVTRWRAAFATAATIFLFVGRLVPEKGAADFIRAVGKLSNRHVVGVICGDGPDRPRLETLAHELGLGDRIRFEGWVDPAGVAIRMAGATALIFPSKKSPDGWVEAQGIVLVEAMRSGLPILASRSGGIPDLVEHGHTGWLFPEADIEALAALMTDLIEDRLADKVEIVDRARGIALREITRENTAAAFGRLLAGLINSKDRRNLPPVDQDGPK